MPTLIFPLHVELEDGTTFDVVADQRDLVRWERHPEGAAVGDESKMMQMLRFLAWSVLQRTGETDLKWPQFDRQLVEAAPVDDEEAGVPADAEDPGRPAR